MVKELEGARQKSIILHFPRMMSVKWTLTVRQNDLYKCCQNGFGIKECVNPIPGNIFVIGHVVSSIEIVN